MFNGRSFVIELYWRGKNKGTVYSDPLGDVWKPTKKPQSVMVYQLPIAVLIDNNLKIKLHAYTEHY
jgi:hypothetical protein